MREDYLRRLLGQIKKNKVSVDEGIKELRNLPYLDLGFAKLDLHREVRKGFPEAIFCEDKEITQIGKIVNALLMKNARVILTHLSERKWRQIKKRSSLLKYNKIARFAYTPPSRVSKKGVILIITAGTGDIPVAEEAAVTAEVAGSRVERLYDVGVAGIHRLFDNKDRIRKANVLIVIAGMEGALASVVGGMASRPVIAVPTSVGYGANFKGITPLLSMLSTCAPGVVCVNIDNGFGAGYFANLINR